MTWSVLESEAPVIARNGRSCLGRTGVALLATLREDGSPRISPVEPYWSKGNLLFGSMSWSQKTRDLQRDPRCVLHSAVSGPDLGEPELKLYGRAFIADAELQRACTEGWWQGRSPETAKVFALDIEQAAFVSWDLENEQMTVWRWSPQRGCTEAARSYPQARSLPPVDPVDELLHQRFSPSLRDWVRNATSSD